MPRRRPVVAGRFYPGDARVIIDYADSLLKYDGPLDEPAVVMAPHAGWIFSGPLAAAALRGVRMPETLVMLCPNHTGLGQPLGVWPEGEWETPLGAVRVNAALAGRLCARGLYAADTASHAREHSLEVLLPLVQRLDPDHAPDIVPVCIGTQDARILSLAGAMLAAEAGAGIGEGSVMILVSSDMNHYENEDATLAKDTRALDCVLAGDPDALLERCRRERITMCGCGPMALALHCLYALRGGRLPGKPARLIGHGTSGPVSGDHERVVGYASARCYL